MESPCDVHTTQFFPFNRSLTPQPSSIVNLTSSTSTNIIFPVIHLAHLPPNGPDIFCSPYPLAKMLHQSSKMKSRALRQAAQSEQNTEEPKVCKHQINLPQIVKSIVTDTP